MIIDAAIVIIVLFFVFLGFKNGLVRTLLHTFGWIVAIALAFLLRKPFANFLEKYTSIHTVIYEKTEHLLSGYSGSLTDSALDASSKTFDGSPGLLAQGVKNAEEDIVGYAASEIANVLFVIVSFLLLFVLIKLVFFIFTLMFSRRHRTKGLVGGLNGLAGAVFGMIQAAILVYFLLALLLPMSYLINPSTYDWTVNTLDRSIFSQYLYEHNLLLSIVREYVPANILPADWFDLQNF